MDNTIKPFEPIKIDLPKIESEPLIVPGAFSGCAHVQTMAEFTGWKMGQVVQENLDFLKRMNNSN